MTQRPDDPLHEVRQWLATASLEGVSLEQLLAGFVQRLDAAGYGVARAYLATSTLNPLLRAEGYVYERATGEVEREHFQHADQVPQAYSESPFAYMFENRITRMYRPLAGPEARLDFPVLRDFASQGFTAWVAALTGFRLLPDEELGDTLGFVSTLCCDLPDGWTAAQVTDIEALLPLLGGAVQGRLFASVLRGLLGTYLGNDASMRVLRGTTKRGDVRSLRAALLYADLRGFTAMSERLEPVALAELLGRHFDCLVGDIEREGGEVLKFMGDGLLAIFPADADTEAQACQSAARTARQALVNLARLAESGAPVLPIDIAIHLGEVVYGNVGSGARLDFTVIGPAVNEAARMEQLCKELGVPVVISQAAARCLMPRLSGLRSLGRHTLAGLAGQREIFTLPESPA